jgi:hypothetical protein
LISVPQTTRPALSSTGYWLSNDTQVVVFPRKETRELSINHILDGDAKDSTGSWTILVDQHPIRDDPHWFPSSEPNTNEQNWKPS